MYKTQDYSHIKGTKGFSDALFDNHFKLYDGYVKNTSKLLENLNALGSDQRDTPGFAEIKRRLGWEFNGMRLHEFFFSQFGGDGKMNPDGKLAEYMIKSFGSYDAWVQDFVATAKMRGIGWAALYHDAQGRRLINFWINEHNENHPASCNLILILDVFEHAYMSDYGTDRSSYIEAFMKSLNWSIIESRIT